MTDDRIKELAATLRNPRRHQIEELLRKAVDEALAARPEEREPSKFLGKLLAHYKERGWGVDLDGGDVEQWLVECGIHAHPSPQKPTGDCLHNWIYVANVTGQPYWQCDKCLVATAADPLPMNNERGSNGS